MTAPEPQVGDIVVYVGAGEHSPDIWRFRQEKEVPYIVTRGRFGSLVMYEAEPTDESFAEVDWFVAAAASLRVVRRASYTEVAAVDEEGAERKAKIALARMLRCSHCRDIELARLGVQS